MNLPGEANVLALHIDNHKKSSDDRPRCLENPRPAGAESTLTENVASPFHTEPGQNKKPLALEGLLSGGGPPGHELGVFPEPTAEARLPDSSWQRAAPDHSSTS